MWRLIKFLFRGDWHLHKWECLEQLQKYRVKDGTITGETHILECKICGNRKKFEI